MKTKKILVLSLLIANVPVIFYLLFLGYYNSLFLDDYGFSVAVKERGLALVKDMYFNWQGRYGILIISCFLFKIAQLFGNLLPLTIFQLLLGYGCFYLLLHSIFDKLGKSFIFLIAVTCFHLAILGLLEFSTFYWVCASPCITLISLTALLIYAVFNTHLNKYLSCALIIISSFFVGGGFEIYSPLVILCLGIVLLCRLKKSGWKSILKRRTDRQLIAALFLLSVFFLIQILAPGNKIRMAVDGHIQSGLPLILKTGKSLIKLQFAIGSKLLYYIASIPLFYWIGYQLQQKKISLPCKYAGRKYFIISCLFLLLFLYIALLPQIGVVGALTPSLRSFSYVSFVIIAFLGYWGVLSGYKQYHKKIMQTTVLASSLCIIGMSCWLISRDCRRVANYHAEIEKRHAQILKLKEEGFTGVAYIEPARIENDQLSLYSVSWNFVREKLKHDPTERGLIQTDFPYEKFSLSTNNPSDWRNQLLKSYFDVQFNIFCSE
jgi:hypothetical protein